MTDETAGRSGLLSGIRVVEVATYIFAPASATVMSDFGAEVIKVEPPGKGDPYRQLGSIPPMPAAALNYCWLLDARNKKSVAVDLTKEAGREILLTLVKSADVFVTNFRPSLLASLRLTEPDLRPLNARLIYAQASGYGEVGPDVEQPGYDMTAYFSRSGLMQGVASEEAEVGIAPPGMGDHPSAMALFGAIMLALYRRERTGQGSKVTSSLMANGAWANSCRLQAAFCGAEHFHKHVRTQPHNALVNHYLAKDGRRFMLCCLRPERDWPQFCRAIGRLELESDPRFSTLAARKEHTRDLVRLLDQHFATKNMEEWRVLFREHQLVFSPVPDTWDVIADGQMALNDVFVPFDSPELSEMRVVNSPIFVADAPKRRPQPPPELGQHTREVLRGLSYDEATIARLAAERVIEW